MKSIDNKRINLRKEEWRTTIPCEKHEEIQLPNMKKSHVLSTLCYPYEDITIIVKNYLTVLTSTTTTTTPTIITPRPPSLQQQQSTPTPPPPPILLSINLNQQQKVQKKYKQMKSISINMLASIVAAMVILSYCVRQIPCVGATESLLGDLQSCQNEGEEVQLDGIKNSKCFKCICQNGFVNCDKESCPSIEDCYLLEPKTSSDTCCRQCKGCVFDGISYASGAEWTDPNDGCKLYKCIANVITESTLKCYTQCDAGQLREPMPNECCPTCQGCKINAQVIAEGEEAVASIDDRCLICQCRRNRLSCVKKSCPILQCPISKQKQYPNECCPRCTEHRMLMPVIGKCIFNNKVYFEGTQFMPDRCSNCTCINGTSVCQRITCPILECAREDQELDGCCPRCISAEVRTECRYNDKVYANNATWNISACRSCSCMSGNIRCSEKRCPEIKCRANEELKVFEDLCCPRCIESAGICTVFGDPHYKTYDGKFFSFQGSCKYLLTADCHDHDFSIRLTNDARGTRRSSWAKTLTMKLKGTRINFGQKMRIKINGTRISLPYSHGSDLSVRHNAADRAVLMHTALGVSVEWDGNNFLQISVPSAYKQRLCGLCGNYNGIARDDLSARDGRNYTDADIWRFASSWKVGGPKACSRKNEYLAGLQPTCKQRKWAAYCWPLRKSSLFGTCENRLNPFNYFESCKMDVCECPHAQCHCDALAAYVHECRRLGVHVPDGWQGVTNCSLLDASKRYQNNTLLVERYDGGDSGKNKLLMHRRKQQQKLHQQNMLQQEFITKHVPKNLLPKKQSNRTPPPLH